MSHDVFGLLRVYLIYWFLIGIISFDFYFIFNQFIVLWDVAHAVLVQLLACKEPPCDGVDASEVS
jgi:hypothetical protein